MGAPYSTQSGDGRRASDWQQTAPNWPEREAVDVRAAYDQMGKGYSEFRATDPDIAAAIARALGGAVSVLNVGAGTGSYEACALRCVAIEPSATMIDQRPVTSAPVIQGDAEHLPVRSGSFDAAMALLTIHHWADLDTGLKELRRVAKRVVVFTFDAAVHDSFWLFSDYIPEATSRGVATPTLAGGNRRSTWRCSCRRGACSAALSGMASRWPTGSARMRTSTRRSENAARALLSCPKALWRSELGGWRPT